MKHNPAFLDDDHPARVSVIHSDLHSLLYQNLTLNDQQKARHMLVIGGRGSGKTTLVRNLAALFGEHGRWLTLTLSEEAYGVDSLGTLWLEALFHLASQTGDSQLKKRYEILKQQEDEMLLRREAHAALVEYASGQKKQLLLILESLDLIAEQMAAGPGPNPWDAFLEQTEITLLCTAVSMPAALKGRRRILAAHTATLNPEACGMLWQNLTGSTITRSRARAYRILTGGNPRFLASLARISQDQPFTQLMQQLLVLIDEHTDHFKNSLESLACVERKVFTALLDLWDPAPARAVSQAARLDVNKTSALLKRLTDRGMVAVSDRHGRKKVYRVAAPLFNIYWRLRRRGPEAPRVRALIHFMTSFFDRDQETGPVSTGTTGTNQVRQPVDMSPEDWHFYGACLYEEGNYDGAEKAFRKAAAMADLPQAWADLGRLLLERRDAYNEAGRAIRKALALAPNNPGYWSLLGELHYREGQFDEAEKVLGSSLNRSVTPEAVETYLQLMQDRGKEMAGVLASLNKVLDQAGRHPIDLNNMAWELYQRGTQPMIAGAETLAREALAKDGDWANRHTLATILLAGGKWDEAADLAFELLTMHPPYEEPLGEIIELFLALATSGSDDDLAARLEGLPTADQYEPLIIGLRIFRGERPAAAREVFEVGLEIAELARTRKSKINLHAEDYLKG